MTFVGNVLGAPGEMAGWSYESKGPGAMGRPAIWLLGWDDVSPQPYDSITAASEIRDGNWDWVQSKQSWHNSAPVTLQNSLYLTSKPAFFGTNVWPWVDPTNGQTGELPAKARFDELTSVGVSRGKLPPAPALSQNYPNPFNPTTGIRFQMSGAGPVNLTVYDLLGREVATLVNEVKEAGTYSVTWNGAGQPSGVYFCRMVAGSYTSTVKMVLAK
jgi:hypothetical protein